MLILLQVKKYAKIIHIPGKGGLFFPLYFAGVRVGRITISN